MTKDQKEIEGLLARRIGLDPVALGPHLVLRGAAADGGAGTGRPR